jgi:peptidoglycan-associated lipoprotein
MRVGTMKKSMDWSKILIVISALWFLFAIGCAKKQSVTEGISEDARSSKGNVPSSGGISEDEITAKRMAEQNERLKIASIQKFINEDVYFDYDDASIRKDARDILINKVEWLKANPSISVTIEGHCDERGTEAYNIALGQRRARNIKSFLINAGIDGARLHTISYGEERPVDYGHTEISWVKNRRGHFRID